jgi:hypothetical protein
LYTGTGWQSTYSFTASSAEFLVRQGGIPYPQSVHTPSVTIVDYEVVRRALHARADLAVLHRLRTMRVRGPPGGALGGPTWQLRVRESRTFVIVLLDVIQISFTILPL